MPEFLLRRESTLSFQLLDDLGRPVNVASASAALRGGPPGDYFGISSDSLGQIRLARLPAGQYDLQVNCANYIGLWLTNISVGLDSVLVLTNQVMQRQGQISGAIVGHGSPWANGNLSIQLNGTGAPIRTSLVDSNGDFSFGALPAVNYTLQLLWSTRGILSNAAAIRVLLGQLTNTSLQLPTACTIAGSILSEVSGAPIPGVWV